MTPYYADDLVTLYLGDCREVTEWLAADVLVTDPPYGRMEAAKHGAPIPSRGKFAKSHGHASIVGDNDLSTRNAALSLWGSQRPAVVFGDLMLAPPPGNKLTMAYLKPPDAGIRGAMGGFRRNLEAVYLLGPWPSALGGRSSLLATNARSQGNPYACAGRYGHPHAKPVDVMETLIAACEAGTIADPFAGSGSTLVGARNQGRRAVGVEIDERYAEMAARRLSQGVLVAS